MKQNIPWTKNDETEDVICYRRKKVILRKIRNSDLRKAFFLTVLLIIMFRCVFGVTLEYGTDMEPMIADRDLLLYYRLQQSYTGGDVVVYEKQKVVRVGRIVAVPGETVQITKEGLLVINGYIQADIEDKDLYDPGTEGGTGTIQLGSQEYYILNDVHDAVADSRTFGAVSEKEIKGHVISMMRRRNL